MALFIGIIMFGFIKNFMIEVCVKGFRIQTRLTTSFTLYKVLTLYWARQL